MTMGVTLGVLAPDGGQTYLERVVAVHGWDDGRGGAEAERAGIRGRDAVFRSSKDGCVCSRAEAAGWKVRVERFEW